MEKLSKKGSTDLNIWLVNKVEMHVKLLSMKNKSCLTYDNN